MSVPIRCATCTEIIGASRGRHFPRHTACHGKENHKKPERTETLYLFGLLKKVFLFYPETHTSSFWKEYTGPQNKFFLWFATFFGTKRGEIVITKTKKLLKQRLRK